MNEHEFYFRLRVICIFVKQANFGYLAFMSEEDEHEITIKGLYPELTLEQQAEAGNHLKAYMQSVWKIYQRKMHVPDDDILSQVVEQLLPRDEE